MYTFKISPSKNTPRSYWPPKLLCVSLSFFILSWGRSRVLYRSDPFFWRVHRSDPKLFLNVLIKIFFHITNRRQLQNIWLSVALYPEGHVTKHSVSSAYKLFIFSVEQTKVISFVSPLRAKFDACFLSILYQKWGDPHPWRDLTSILEFSAKK